MRVVVGSLRLPSHWLRQGAVLILLQPVELALLLPLPGWPAHSRSIQNAVCSRDAT